MLLIQIIILQVVVFGAVIYVLKRILYQDTESSINRLDRVYQDLLKKQKDLTQKIEQAEKEYNEKKEEGTLVASKLKTEAMDEIRKKQDEMIRKAKSEAEELVKKAHESTDNYHKEIEKKLQRKLIDQSAELLASSISGKAAEILHAELLKDFMARINEMDFSGVGSHINTLTIKTPFALKKEELEKFNSFVTLKINRPIKVEEVVDKSLVAGVLFLFGTLLLDGSLLNRVRDSAEGEKKKIELQS